MLPQWLKSLRHWVGSQINSRSTVDRLKEKSGKLNDDTASVLLIDDSQIELEVLNLALNRDNRAIFSCRSKAEALAVPPDVFDIVVIDVFLSDASTAACTISIIEYFGAAKCVVHTAVSPKMEIIREIAKHCRVVHKNADLTEICQAVEEIENAS